MRSCRGTSSTSPCARSSRSWRRSGSATPACSLLVDGCELADLSTVGDGKHLRFRVRQRGRDSGSAIAFGMGAQLDRFRREGALRRRVPPAGEPLERRRLAAARRAARLRRRRRVRRAARVARQPVEGGRGGLDAGGAADLRGARARRRSATEPARVARRSGRCSKRSPRSPRQPELRPRLGAAEHHAGTATRPFRTRGGGVELAQHAGDLDQLFRLPPTVEHGLLPFIGRTAFPP